MAAWVQAASLADTGQGGCPMRIERRDPTLKYPRAVREDKRRLVLDWLLEFQFSSVELLAQRLGLTYRSSYKFFRALIKRHYSGVYYLFDREEDLVYYQTLFAAEAWPEYHYNRKTGNITPAGTHFKPDTIERLRDCFLFIHESHTHTRDSLQKRGVG